MESYLTRLIVCILMLSSSMSLFGHGLNLSIVELTEEEGQYFLSFNLSRIDLMTSVMTAYPELDEASLESHINDYMISNFSLTINNECQEFAIKQIVFDKSYIRISAAIPFSGRAQNISLSNSCIIDYNEDHENIFKVNLNGKLRTFRMTASRTSINLNYSS